LFAALAGHDAGIAARQRRHDDGRCVFFGWLFVIVIVVLVLAVIGFMSLIRGRA
jgi:hypothetical protein